MNVLNELPSEPSYLNCQSKDYVTNYLHAEQLGIHGTEGQLAQNVRPVVMCLSPVGQL